jgi:hypothetical protein
MNISTTQARGEYTNKLIALYKERPKVMTFLRSFFKNVESATKYVSIEVQRGTEKIAADVMRGTEGNRNSFSNVTGKTFLPPYYREYFDATELDLYDSLFTADSISAPIFAQFLDSVAEKFAMMVDKIERAYEKQCADVLLSGIITLNDGTTIDFKRKAGSMVDNTASPWSGAYSPFTQLEAGAQFLRETGKSQGTVYNAIFGPQVLAAFLDNADVKERQNLFHMNLDAIRAPQREAVGGTYHGEISIGSYKCRIWTYPEVYTAANGTTTPYLEAKKVIMIPEAPNFVMGFAAVPRLLSENAAPQKGAYVFGDFKDERNTAHIFDVKSAGVALPVAVDQIYTMEVLA